MTEDTARAGLDLADRLFRLMAYMAPGWEKESESLGVELWLLPDDELSAVMRAFWSKATEGEEGYPLSDVVAFWHVMSFPMPLAEDDAPAPPHVAPEATQRTQETR